ncbi:unnamed protein product [Durusdinium trenchii]|uniref:Uncharacterized protein n=1 Tax=Durusdinium trenchii TaxID=1381693 RepID=A0ABP0JAJ9_9DINO
MTMPRMRHAVQVGLALSLLRWAFVDPAASPRHTAASPSPRRSTSVTALRATWREVHQEAKDLEQKLREVIIESNQRVRELEGMFVERSKASDEKATTPQLSTLGFGVFQARAERLFPDVETNRPILAGELATAAPIVGRYTSSPSLRVPARLEPEQLQGQDDPSASAEENELWKTYVQLLTDTLEPLWPEAEERVRAVMMAEFDAEQRRDEQVGAIRKRVLKQMMLANEGIRTEAELDAILTVLQTDERLLKYLGLLMQCCLQSEKLQERLTRRQKEAP